MFHISDPCASSPWPLDQTVIRPMVEMKWSCASLHASMHWGGGARGGRSKAIFVACPHATVLERPPGSTMWKEDTRGTKGGATAPRGSLPATAFAWSVLYWDWTTSTLVLGPNSSGERAFSLFVCEESAFMFSWLHIFTLFTCIPSMWPQKNN
jgi:hypothetical protein